MANNFPKLRYNHFMTQISLYSLPQLKKIRDNFINELILAARGEKTSLAFIKNSLPLKPVVADDELFQLMAIGGSVFHMALAKKSKNKISLQKKVKFFLPHFSSREIFCKFFLEQLDPRVNTVALNLAYHLVPSLRHGLVDDRLVIPTKEQPFSGLVNKLIGQELEIYVFEKLKRRIRVAVANDAICLLLSTLPSQSRSSQRLSTVAGIVGAGTNFAFFLSPCQQAENENIAVNLESGNFDKFPPTATGKIIDQNSDQRGQQLLEKEVSGNYLYRHYNLLVKHSPSLWDTTWGIPLWRSGLQHQQGFGVRNPEPSRRYVGAGSLVNRGEKNRLLLSTFELSQQAQLHPGGVNRGVTIARKLIERSASLIACQIAGIYLFKTCRENKKSAQDTDSRHMSRVAANLMDNARFTSLMHVREDVSKHFKKEVTPFKFIMEGSLFWHGWHYQQFVEDYLKKLAVRKNSVKFINVKNSSLIGASRLIAKLGRNGII